MFRGQGQRAGRTQTFVAKSTRDTLIRRTRASDEAGLVEVLRDTFESTWRPNISVEAVEAYVREGRASRYVAQRGHEFWVAERAGQVVGLVHWENDFVHALHVRRSCARRGVGGRLMDRAEAEIARSGFDCVRLETDTFNLTSQAFYRSRGYSEADRYPDEEWNSGLTTILFIKALG